jgi:hypothetical protein
VATAAACQSGDEADRHASVRDGASQRLVAGEQRMAGERS